MEHLYVVEYRVRLLRPTVDARHVMSLLRLQWERRSLPEGITRIRIVISERAPLQVIEQTLWNMGDRQTSQDAAALLEKLTSRLGRDRVLRAVLQADGQPELAYRYEPCLEPPDPRIRSPDTANPVIHFRLSRPLWCERTPTPVEVVSFVPDGLPPGGCSERFVHSGRVLDPQDRCEQSSCAGPPWRLTWQGEEYLIARSWGPERITTGWWRGAHIRRDYYHVETTDGHRLWLFRDRIEDRWYLQAAFD